VNLVRLPSIAVLLVGGGLIKAFYKLVRLPKRARFWGFLKLGS
jgi:hypothetical protein